MRGRTDKQGPMFLLINVEAELPPDHPLRAVKRRADPILSVPPEFVDETESSVAVASWLLPATGLRTVLLLSRERMEFLSACRLEAGWPRRKTGPAPNGKPAACGELGLTCATMSRRGAWRR